MRTYVGTYPHKMSLHDSPPRRVYFIRRGSSSADGVHDDERGREADILLYCVQPPRYAVGKAEESGGDELLGREGHGGGEWGTHLHAPHPRGYQQVFLFRLHLLHSQQ